MATFLYVHVAGAMLALLFNVVAADGPDTINRSVCAIFLLAVFAGAGESTICSFHLLFLLLRRCVYAPASTLVWLLQYQRLLLLGSCRLPCLSSKVCF